VPFTAAYTGIALTESLSVFAIAWGIYAAGRALAAADEGKRDVGALVGAGCAAGLAAMLRPDGSLLCLALAIGLFYYSLRPRSSIPARRPQFLSAFTATAIYSLVALAPIAVWTARNWIDFQVFQPLAPRYLNDPGETYIAGFYQWMRTWAVEYVSTGNVYWHVGTQSISVDDLPPAPSIRPPSARSPLLCSTNTTAPTPSPRGSMPALPSSPPSASAPTRCAITSPFRSCASQTCC